MDADKVSEAIDLNQEIILFLSNFLRNSNEIRFCKFLKKIINFNKNKIKYRKGTVTKK